jgi:hypothetical protein
MLTTLLMICACKDFTLLITRLLPFAFILFALNTQAKDNLYGIVTIGFADTEFGPTPAETAAYKFGLGYQFHRQWYVEAGYQQIADESMNLLIPTNLEEAESFQGGLEGGAIYLSVLGKASGRTGELFYRLGVLNVDLKGQSLVASDTCTVGRATNVSLATGESYSLCEYDEGVFAGAFGIGFDFFIGPKAMLRAEVEHIEGEHNFSSSSVHLGLRYNF